MKEWRLSRWATYRQNCISFHLGQVEEHRSLDLKMNIEEAVAIIQFLQAKVAWVRTMKEKLHG